MKNTFAPKKSPSVSLAGLLLFALLPCLAQAATFTVNHFVTLGDAAPGDGVCEVTPGLGDCSLAAAIEEATTLTGAHSINIDATVSSIPFTFYDLSGADFTITGPGSDLLTVTADSFGTMENDSISGMTIIHGSGQTILADNVSITDSIFFIPANSVNTLVKNASGSATIDSSEFIGSTSSTTPMISVEAGGSLTVSNSTLRDHSSSGNGGAIFTDGTLTINDSVFSGNGGGNGTAIYASTLAPLVTISGSSFIGNTGVSILLSESPSVVISDSRFTDNIVSFSTVHSTVNAILMDISGSAFADNSLSGGAQGASAIYFDSDLSDIGTLTLSNSSITGNISTGTNNGTIFTRGIDHLTNVTISDNQINDDAGNIAHYTHSHRTSGAQVEFKSYVFNSTISNNVNLGAGFSGFSYDIGTGGNRRRMGNSIITNNTNANGAFNCQMPDPQNSEGYNIIGVVNNTCLIAAIASDQFGTAASPIDPMLGPLTTDAATGLSYRAPLPGSPAIDMGEVGSVCNRVIDLAGTLAAVPTDMLGNPRPVDSNNDSTVACDIGAIEVQPDTTPDAFAFTDQTDVALSTVIESDLIVVAGIEAPAAISISNGEYRINTGPFTSVSGVVNNGDTVEVQHMSAAAHLVPTDSILTIGGVSDTFTSITLAADTTPDTFAFSDQTDVELDTLLTSDSITVSGIDAATEISISNGEYRINAGAFTSMSGEINNGDTVEVRHRSHADNATTTDTELTIGGVSDTFTSTTVEEAKSGGGGGSFGLLMLLLALPLWLRRQRRRLLNQ